MAETLKKAVAIVGVGAVLPDAPDASTFWKNLESGRYSISDVQPDRWDPALYYDSDPKAPDRSYSKIGGWVREWSGHGSRCSGACRYPRGLAKPWTVLRSGRSSEPVRR